MGVFFVFWGVFVLFGGVFALLGGVFVLLGCFFLFFARQRDFLGGLNFKAYYTKTGNSRSGRVPEPPEGGGAEGITTKGTKPE